MAKKAVKKKYVLTKKDTALLNKIIKAKAEDVPEEKRQLFKDMEKTLKGIAKDLLDDK